jgi:hypothetical protein
LSGPGRRGGAVKGGIRVEHVSRAVEMPLMMTHPTRMYSETQYQEQVK